MRTFTTIGLLVLALPLQAQNAPGTTQRFEPLLLPGVYYGAPEKISGGLAVFLPTHEEGGFRRRGFIADGRVGQGGATGSFGFASIVEYLELDARGAVHRTWASPRGATPHATYLGGEAGASIAYVRFTLGVAHRVSGLSDADETILTWSAGVHFPIGLR